MALAPFALFVVSDTITVDVRFQARFALLYNWPGTALTLATYPQHLNRVLTDEAAYGSYLLAPVLEPDLSNPYSATPCRQYNSAGKELPPTEYPRPSRQTCSRPQRSLFSARVSSPVPPTYASRRPSTRPGIRSSLSSWTNSISHMGHS